MSCIITAIAIDRSRIVQVAKYPMDIEVKDDDIMGVNVDPDGFHFGSLNRGGGARREFKIHQVEEDILVKISKKGEMAKWVGNPDNFIIRKGGNRTISFSIGIPHDAPLGNYTGEVIVVLRKA